jgi:hypothetical protein
MHEWERVTGPDLDSGKRKRYLENNAILKDEVFIEACKWAGIKPTRRQASKWKTKKGIAYKKLRLDENFILSKSANIK